MLLTDFARQLLAEAADGGKEAMEALEDQFEEPIFDSVFASAAGLTINDIREILGKKPLSSNFANAVESWYPPQANGFLVEFLLRQPPHPVTLLYLHYLRRLPDDEGYDYWNTQFRTKSLNTVVRDFINGAKKNGEKIHD